LSNFGKRLEDYRKRLDDFSSRLSSHERIHLFFFGTVVGRFGVTIKLSGDLNNKFDKKFDEINKKFDKKFDMYKEIKIISQEIHKNRSFLGLW
jgi:hypothetical protein